MTIIAGIGCRAGCPADDIVTVVHQAAATVGRPVSALAAPDFKAGEGGLHEAARRLALPLLLIDRPSLDAAQPRCPTRSIASAQTTGIPSVAEGSALAAAGPAARLLLPRIAGPRATCALAEPA